MNLQSLRNLINASFQYVMMTSKKYDIDESHALSHSMKVFHHTKSIINAELIQNPFLLEQKDIIYTSAILHDMCDKKYMDENEGIQFIDKFLSAHLERHKIDVVKSIITSMSYSKVKTVGYPNLGEYQLAFHIVRESDLLTAYDVPRCIVYSMFQPGTDYSSTIHHVNNLFESRMLQHINDDLFVTEHSKLLSRKLHIEAKTELDVINDAL